MTETSEKNLELDARLKQSVGEAGKRSLYAQVALAASAALGAGQIVAYANQRALLESLQAGVVLDPAVGQASDSLVARLASLQVLCFIVAMVMFLRWLHRSVQNARRLQDEVWLPPPREAVTSFFIPFVNLFKPVQIISSLHRAVWPEQLPPRVTYEADPAAGYRGNAARQVVHRWTRVSAPVGWWWLFHLLPAAERFFQLGSPGTIPGLLDLTRTAMVFSGVRIVADLLGILVIRGIESRSVELALRREAAARAAAEDHAPADAGLA
jgi:hypothetical protein